MISQRMKDKMRCDVKGSKCHKSKSRTCPLYLSPFRGGQTGVEIHLTDHLAAKIPWHTQAILKFPSPPARVYQKTTTDRFFSAQIDERNPFRSRGVFFWGDMFRKVVALESTASAQKTGGDPYQFAHFKSCLSESSGRFWRQMKENSNSFGCTMVGLLARTPVSSQIG